MRPLFAPRALTLILAGVFTANAAEAQGGSLSGRVLSDSSSLPVAGVEVRLSGTERSIRTDARGAFRLGRLRAGRYAVLVRMPGYVAITDTVDIDDDEEFTKDYRLTAGVTALDSVRVTAPGSNLSARMRTFERRRAEGQGRFITADELRKNEDRSLRAMLSRLPALRFAIYQGSTFIALGRSSTLSRKAIPWDLNSPSGCWLQVYLDAIRIYSPLVAQAAPSIEDYRVRDLEAVEFYPSSATTPVELGSASAPCGTLVLWTREK